jgi:7-cyano-7-deazaguanine synthase in queuosine biosynthesis
MPRIREAPGFAPSLAVDVAESGVRSPKGWLRCEIGENVEFNTTHLETYCFASWEPIVYDALLVAAAVEFADRSWRRPALTWERELTLRIPVHDPARWHAKPVADALRGTLSFLTGDRWDVSFRERREPVSPPRQGRFTLPAGLSAVIPFSDGLDSRAVAGLMAREMGQKLIRVRLGSRQNAGRARAAEVHPFTSVPYDVLAGPKVFVESSARSRGFKFALISGLAAYVGKAGQVLVPESGQGALGPALVTVGQAYEDYRSHPLFTDRMEQFLFALLGHRVRFKFPRLWHTKAETLKTFVDECDDARWSDTWSCWQQSRQVSVDHKKRHCGICAACMLRRMSIHAAGLTEVQSTYVWEDLKAGTFHAGAAATFAKNKVTRKLHEYAIAGALHMDHLAGLRASASNAGMLDRSAFQLSRSLRLPEADTRARLDRLLLQHEVEWERFIASLGRSSFLANWAIHAQ